MTMLRAACLLAALACGCEPSAPAGTSASTALASTSATGDASAALPQTSASASDSMGGASDFDFGHFDHGPGSGMGGQPARPPLHANIRMSAPSVTGKLPPEVVQRIVRQNFKHLARCYDIALEAGSKLAGRVTTSFTIGADGNIRDVAQTSDIADKALLACFKDGFSTLSFPAPESGVVNVRYPLVLAPPEYTFTIGGKLSLQVGAAELSVALEAAGYKVTGSADSQLGTAPITLKAEKAGAVLTLTFDPKRALSDEHYRHLKKGAVWLEEGEWFLAVEGDKQKSQALIDAIYKKIPKK